MNIIVISDSHGIASKIDKVIDMQITKPDALMFLGDGLRDLSRCNKLEGIDVYSVKGNCDWESFYGDFNAADEQMVDIKGIKILLTHGHLHGVKSTYHRLELHAYTKGADIVLFGHTHEKFESCIHKGDMLPDMSISDRDLYIMNPGSLCFGDSWGVITIDKNNRILISHGHL